MKFQHHDSNNMLLGPPKGMDNCEPLPATMIIEEVGTRIVSFWRPNEAELAILNAGGCVALHIFGAFHPPVAIEAQA